jgi:hypothetical protein
MPVFMPWPQSGRMQYEKIKSNQAAGRDGNCGRLDGSLGGGINLGFEAFRVFLGRDGQLAADLGNGHKVYNSHHLSWRRNIHDTFLLGHHLIINSAPAPQSVNNRLALRRQGGYCHSAEGDGGPRCGQSEVPAAAYLPGCSPFFEAHHNSGPGLQ